MNKIHNKKQELDIIFVYPPSSINANDNNKLFFQINIGSAYIMSYLNQIGFHTKQYITNEPINIFESAKQIVETKAKIVGFTVYDITYSNCILVAKGIKEINPDIIIVFGGPTPTIHSETILKNNNCIDICVRNEGEETVLELLTVLENANFKVKKAQLENVKGITYKMGKDIIFSPNRNVFLSNKKIKHYLDKYPSPYLTDTLKPNFAKIITARGCNQHCTYCNCALLCKNHVTTHSIDRVIEEMEYISNKNQSKNITAEILDDAFTLLPNRAKNICLKMIENKIKLGLTCITRCDKVNKELLEIMKEAGFKSIGFSLESASPRILRNIGKVQNPDTKADNNYDKEKAFISKFLKYTSYAKKLGFHVFASIMVGLPDETIEEARESVEMITKANLDDYMHNIFLILPSTPIFYNYTKYRYKLRKLKDKVQYRTIHTFDPYKVKLGPNANYQKEGIETDKYNLEVLSLSIKRKKLEKYFNNVILLSNNIENGLIDWLKKYLAINGTFIQIYSNLEEAKKNHEINSNKILEYGVPTQSYTAYHIIKDKEANITLKANRTFYWGDDASYPIKLISTKNYFTQNNSNPLQSLCIETEKEDSLYLYNILNNIAQKKDKIKYLMNRPIYPYFQNICKWNGNSANCKYLETVIIDSLSNIKFCWNGKAIGTVGMPFEKIINNLKKLQEKTEIKRHCNDCYKNEVCVKCLFVEPLSEQEYCALKYKIDIESEVHLIKSFDVFKAYHH